MCLNKILVILLMQLKRQEAAITRENVVNHADVQVTAECKEVCIVLNSWESYVNLGRVCTAE